MAVVSSAELRSRIDSLLSVVISFVRDPTAGSKREGVSTPDIAYFVMQLTFS